MPAALPSIPVPWVPLGEIDMRHRTLAAIPAYDEDVAIGSMVLRCSAHVDEVLVVDDGSGDRTAQVAKKAGAVVYKHERNEGKGAAIQSALHYAQLNGFDAMVLMDGDGQHDPDEIPALLEPILRGESDLVCGLRSPRATDMPLHRRMGKRVLDYLTALGSAGTLTDSQCGFRALSRLAIGALRLEERDFGVESEMLIEAREKGLRIMEVPVRVRYDVDGSTKGPVTHGLGVVDRVLKIVAVRHPILFFGVPGLFSMLMGLWLGLRTMEIYAATQVFAIGYALLVVIFFTLGPLFVFAGIMLNVLPMAISRAQAKHNQGPADGKWL